MGDRLEHVRLWMGRTSPASFNERLEIRTGVIRADEGLGSVCRHLVALAEVGD